MLTCERGERHVTLGWFGFALALVCAGCHGGSAKFPWGSSEPSAALQHSQVSTLNDYSRTRSHVWVRRVSQPTRAALDYAAYHANFMIADPEPETPISLSGQPDTSHPFAGQLDASTLTADVAKTPLDLAEKQAPLAFSPLSEFLQARKLDGAEALANVGAAVRGENWGLKLPPGVAGQELTELFIHREDARVEFWAKVEFQPWFTPFADASDQDGDGFPELYGRVADGVATRALTEAIETQYVEPVLSPTEVRAWANQLSSYWYPSYNTDLMPAGSSWPDEQTESSIKQELAGKTFAAPTIVLRGKPMGEATYNVFLVEGAGDAIGTTSTAEVLSLAKTEPSPETRTVLEEIERELAAHGGTWPKWYRELTEPHRSLKKRLRAMPPKVKALAGKDGFLFYRNDLEYVTGGDLEKQRKTKNPLPFIVEFKELLARQGVDFLFVPVPTKLEIYPELLDPALAPLAGEILNPAARKLLASLANQGVEVLDLLPAFLEARRVSDGEPFLFQHQDTHWTDRGLRLTAQLLAERVKKYPWYAELGKHAIPFDTRETTFTRFGDLQSRLPEAAQSNYQPETLVAHQVLRAGQLYDDQPESPIVMLGDSFTGVDELTDAEHAGVSAHLARGVGYPVDLVMSYGGGPNVRQKLMRRGVEGLATKKLVIWMMTARDLYDYWEDWEALNVP